MSILVQRSVTTPSALMSTRDDDDAMKAAKTQFDVHKCVDWLIDLVVERAAHATKMQERQEAVLAQTVGGLAGDDSDDDEEEDEEEGEEEEEEEDEYEDDSEDGKGVEVDEEAPASKEDAEQVAGGHRKWPHRARRQMLPRSHH